jgi:polyketide biosynthesis 3-hydroxy-3-methylglutaryl-CoA synthase-like enzyme PksG
MDEYELVSDMSVDRMGGLKDKVFDPAPYNAVYSEGFASRGLLVLDRISNFHREYKWS